MGRRGRFKQAAAAKRSIDERSIEADNRSALGHLEGDTIHGCRNSQAAILSIRDRSSRVHFFEKVSNLGAETVTAAIIRLLHTIPLNCRQSLSLDRGAEFADWKRIEAVFPDLKVYFCDPYCPYQKGSNERGNRDLRKYFPKGTNFDGISNDDIKYAQRQINQNPMKLHQWRSPAEVAPELAAA